MSHYHRAALPPSPPSGDSHAALHCYVDILLPHIQVIAHYPLIDYLFSCMIPESALFIDGDREEEEEEEDDG